MISNPKLPFYIIVIIAVVVNVLQALLHYLTGTGLIVVNLILLGVTTLAQEYGVSTSVNNALLSAGVKQ
jgi:hypothetical protein